MAVLRSTVQLEHQQRRQLDKRKRGEEHLTVLREMHSADLAQQELNRAQQERHLQLALVAFYTCIYI
ncbi:hypothetical protein NQZ68_040599 [Dissostichus eleginoides]|nr:hypothetical protein NQZ68_040599 [Dissostichus eleginoides]